MSRVTSSPLSFSISSLSPVVTSSSTSPITIALTNYAYLLFRATGVDSADVAFRITCDQETYELRIITRATMTITEYIHSIYNAIPSTTSVLTSKTIKHPLNINIQQQRSQEAPMAALDANIQVTPDTITVTFSYDPLPTRGMADVRSRCAQHYESIMKSLLSTPTTSPLSSISALDEAERRLIMHEFSGRDHADDLTPTDACLHDLYEATASRYPLNTALVYEKQTMTYAEMDAKCNQLARYMRSQGIGVGSFVAMFLPRSMDVYIALIAILKAGATYVPIDPEYPADRVQYILTDCKVRILLTRTVMLTPALKEVMPEFTNPICMDTFQLTMSKERISKAETGVTNRDLSYVIYTSGSTGRPKGVMIEHRSAVNLVRAEQLIYHMTPQDRVYQGFSIAFDASVEEVWMAFYNGAALVIATHEMIHAGPGLCPILQELQVTALSTVPTLISMMDQDIPSIKLLIMGGEACPKDLAERWSRGRRMYNTYGPTEATVICTYALMDADAPIVTIGKPVPTYFSYILDPHLQPVPIGVTGELHIGGTNGSICLSRGYVGRDDLTAEKFIPFPKTLNDPEFDMQALCPKLYKTGDLARYTEDGEIEFCGRIDQQVKIRGFRVELSEIESVMMKMGGKTMAAVVAVREDVPGIQNLVGYVKFSSPHVNEAGFGPTCFDENRFKDLIRVPLPPYMIPSSITVLDDFPTLPSGKVNRKALPAPKVVAVVEDDDDDDETDEVVEDIETKHEQVIVEEKKPEIAPVVKENSKESKSNYEPPRTPMEKKLCDVWKKLFQRKKISATDDFFKLGGHSLLAAWLVTALRKDKDTAKVTMTDIYGAPTIRALAQRLGGGVPVVPTVATPPTPVSKTSTSSTTSTSTMPTSSSYSRLPSSNSSPRVSFTPTPKSVLKKHGININNDMETPLLDDVDGDVDVDDEDDEETDEGAETLPMSVGISVHGSEAEPLSDAQRKLAKDFRDTSYTSYIICGFFQLCSMFLLFAFPAYQVGIPYGFFLEIRRDATWPVVGWFLAAASSIYPAYIALCIALKWLLIGKYKEGRYPLWGWYYFRWWFIQRIKFGVPTMYLRGTLLINFFLRCMGAKIGNNVFLNTHMFDAPDLIEIGDDTSVGLDAQLSNFTIQNGYLIIERIRIGKRCYVGARAVLHGNTSMGDDAHLGLMSMLPHGTVVPPRQHWRGSPAQSFKSPVPEFQDDIGRIPPSGSFANSSNAARRESNAHRVISAGGEDSPSSIFVSLQANPNDVDDVLVVHPQSTMMKMLVLFGQLVMILFVMPAIIILGFAPGLYVLHVLLPSPNYVPNLRHSQSYFFLVTAIPTAVMFNLIVALSVVVIRYILMPFGVKPGDYRIHTFWYLRKWCIDNVMLMTLHTIHSMYATLYLIPWLRLLGAKIGAKAELSTAHFSNPELLTVGDGSFVADNVYLGVATVHMGIMRIGEVHVGSRTFLGNSAVIASGCHVGDDCLLGVLSTVPVDEESTNKDPQPPLYAAPHETEEGEQGPGARRLSDVLKVYNCPEPFIRVKNQSAWLGSPAMYLPARATSAEEHSNASTYNPTWSLYLQRLFIEFFRVNLPVAIYCVSLLVLLGDLRVIKNQIIQNDTLFWALFPCYYMSAGVVICVFCALLKWIVVGQYQKGEHPLWSGFVWRTELEVGVRESMSHPYFIDYLRGTPFCAMWFRVLGAKIGKRVYMDTCNITEPELVHVGDDVALEGDCDLQTHLFEDRVMKCSTVNVGDKCAIGPLSVALYDSVMQEGSAIHSLSLLMKGEELPPWTSWEGLPTRPTAPLSLEHAQREQQERLIKNHAVRVRKIRHPHHVHSSSTSSSLN